MLNTECVEAYSADIAVTFDGFPPFLGKVYVQGDGNHAVFDWPKQENTEATTELAEFKTQTKWVTKAGECIKSKFSDPDPKFVGMVSHEGYERISSDAAKNVYSSEGITCTYDIDAQGREVISTIAFSGAKIEFTNVTPGPQDPARFEPPRDSQSSG